MVEEEVFLAIMGYRLGDLIRFHQRASLKLPEQSLAHQYFVNSRFPKNQREIRPVRVDFDAFERIIEEKKLSTIDQFAIHLRLGDQYHERVPIERYIKIIYENRSQIKTDKCKIYCKSHRNFTQLNRKTNTYVENLSKKIQELGFRVDSGKQCFDDKTKDSFQHIDADFLEIVKSKYLIAGKRGFGWLSACMNKNNVFWDAYDFANGIPDLVWDKKNRKNYRCKELSHHIGHIEGFIYQRKNDQLFNLVKMENPPRYRA